MIYIYDILLNFCDNDLLYDFYEWESSDNIENIKRIKLICVEKNILDDLINYECRVDTNLLLKIYKTCEVYTNKKVKVLDYCVLVSDGIRVIALEFNNKGDIIYKSKLLIDEEDEISELANNLEIYNLNYIKGKKILNERFFTRHELLIRNYLYHEIEDSYKNKKYDKLRYLYQEYFDKDSSSYKKIKDELIDSIKDNIDSKHINLYNLLRLTHSKKQV